ncbi:MAG TPA: DUF6345 domain-containing protein [Thermoanaerobaculia bacterium]|nr:DUF6345 domain-containing protein [Thermoanaerobaculia bacterium]
MATLNRSGIAWIANYKNPCIPNLPQAGATATGFADTLGADKAFKDLVNDNVVEERFERKNGQQADIEAAHIFYYVGHGSGYGLLLAARNQGDDGVVSSDELRAGHNLAYAVFDSCSLLDPGTLQTWDAAFDGLHYMLGFAQQVFQDAARGSRFAGFLNSGCTIPDAWRRAAIETVASSTVRWGYLREIHDPGAGPPPTDETWSNDQPLAKSPLTPFVFISHIEEGKTAALAPVSARPKRVKLFRTPAAATTEEELQALAAKFGLSTSDVRSGPGWRELRNDVSTLYLYDQVGSFWWSRTPTPLTELFHAREPALLRAVAEDKARAYLDQAELNDPRLVSKPLSYTVETQREHRPDGHGRLLTRTVAVHVNYGFALDDLPVLGPGAKLRVSFEGLEVSEVFRFWREPVEGGLVKIDISPEDAEERLRASREFAMLPHEAITLIGKPRLGYYSRSISLEQAALVPVYEVRGLVSTRALGRFEFTRFVNAAPTSLEFELPELVH